MNFVTVSEARGILEKESFYTQTIENILPDALNFYLSEPIYAPINIPSFNNSAMDGYAFSYQEYKEGRQLQIDAVIQAGDTKKYKIEQGKVARIFTGAMIPEGVDTVVMQEKVIVKDNLITIEDHLFKIGHNIRKEGSQSKKGEIIAPKHTKVTPAVAALIAGFGINKVKVFALPKVVVLITGDELVPAGQSLEKGQVYESNSVLLQALLQEQGIKEITILKVKDNKEDTQNSIEKALQNNEVVLISGGISVGEFDFVKESLDSLGVQQLFYKIQQKPGKPLFFGKREQRYVFALPGNPASVFTCFQQYVKPFLEGIKGKQQIFTDKTTAVLSSSFDKKNNFTLFLKARRAGKEVTVLTGQESYRMDVFIQANCLVELPNEKRRIEKGEEVTVWDI